MDGELSHGFVRVLFRPIGVSESDNFNRKRLSRRASIYEKKYRSAQVGKNEQKSSDVAESR